MTTTYCLAIYNGNGLYTDYKYRFYKRLANFRKALKSLDDSVYNPEFDTISLTHSYRSCDLKGKKDYQYTVYIC